MDKADKALLNESAKLQEAIKKLDSIDGRLTEMASLTGKLSEEHRIIILKQRASKAHFQVKLTKINEELPNWKKLKMKNESFDCYLREGLSKHFYAFWKIFKSDSPDSSNLQSSIFQREK
ncbi:hypothetical protein [Cytobacillus pseudoceanisediminis]